MIPHIEKEYKMMLQQAQYEQLLSDYQATPFLQTNYYYESGYRDKTIRIRFVDNKYLFTLKVSKKGYKDEYEFEIKDNSLQDPRIQQLFTHFNITNPKYLGSMDTNRAIINIDNGELCFDKSIYNGITDYELEYELTNPNIDTFDVLKTILDKYHLIYTKSIQSKYARFLETL